MGKNHSKDIVKRKVGRPTVMTDETVKKLESIFKVGGTVEEAVAYAGISKQTYYDEIKRNPDFLTKMKAARHYADIVAKHVVVQAITKDKDLDTAKWWLDRRQFRDKNLTAIQVNVSPILGGISRRKNENHDGGQEDIILDQED